jgi:hypothetical protein
MTTSPTTATPSGSYTKYTSGGGTYGQSPNTAAATSGSATAATYSATPTGIWPGGKMKAKRSSPYTDPDSPSEFPKLVKMVEKRKPHGNIEPYCQQMQVLNNWQIMPIPDVPTICIDETEFAKPTGSNRLVRRKTKLQKKDSTQELESNCICEWFSSPLREYGGG